MSATNLDLPILASAEQIRRREFVTIRRGYDPDQVRAYLEQLADQVELMRSMLREAKNEADAAIRASAQPQPDPFERVGQRVANVIREADEAAEAIRGEARADAERLVHDARVEADRIRTDAQAKAEEARSRADVAVRSAREEADRTIAGLAMKRDALVDQLASMQERLVGVAKDLENAMDVQVSLPDITPISKLLDPDADDEGNGHAAPTASAAPASTEPGPPASGGEPAGSDEAKATADDAEHVVVVADAEAPAAEPTVLDPSYEELWEGTDAIELTMPDIPALDLDWGDDEERA